MTQGSNTGGGNQGGSGSTDPFATSDLGSSMSSPIGTGSASGGTGGSTSGMAGSTGAGGGMSGASSGGMGSSGSVGQVVDQVQDTAGQVVDQVQDKAGQVVDQAKETVSTQVASQKDRAAESLTMLAQAIRQSGDHLRGQEQTTVAGYTDQAARYVEQLSGFLRERDVNDMLYDVERYARRNPTMFIGSAFAIGLLAGRFLKSSSRSNYQGSRGQYPLAPRTPSYGSQSYTYSAGTDYRSTGGSYGATGGTSYGSAGSGGSFGSGTAGTGGTIGATSGTIGGSSGAIGGSTGTIGGSTGGLTGATTGSETSRLGDADSGLDSSDQFSARREDL